MQPHTIGFSQSYFYFIHLWSKLLHWCFIVRNSLVFREEAPCLVAVDQCPFVLGLTNENSELILDECAQLTEGLKTRERHLFLLSDTLVIAKLK